MRRRVMQSVRQPEDVEGRRHYMKSKSILLFSILIAAVFVVIYLFPIWNKPELDLPQIDQSDQQTGSRYDWTRKTFNGVELWVAWKEVTHPADGEWMHIYAFMEGQYFNEETLRQLFARMSEEYSEFKYLSVNIYSDKEKLAQQVNDYRLSLKIPHTSLPPEKPKEEQTPRNHFDAYYYRAARNDGLQSEWFAYTPNPTKDDSITITLKP